MPHLDTESDRILICALKNQFIPMIASRPALSVRWYEIKMSALANETNPGQKRKRGKKERGKTMNPHQNANTMQDIDTCSTQ